MFELVLHHISNCNMTIGLMVHNLPESDAIYAS